MPSGKTHDAITIFLTAPVFAGAYVVTRDLWLSTFLSAGFLFGGLLFGVMGNMFTGVGEGVGDLMGGIGDGASDIGSGVGDMFGDVFE